MPINALVGGGGFEPPKAEPSDLQSDPFDRSGTPPNEGNFLLSTVKCQAKYNKTNKKVDILIKMVLAPGIEPGTY